MNTNSADPKIILALDYSRVEPVYALVDRLDPKLCQLKVGKELFTQTGPILVRELVKRGFKVFLDLKFHDIPNTVAAACAAAADLGVWMMNVHASGGRAMLTAARERLSTYEPRPRLIAVTLLTSLDEADLSTLGLAGPIPDAVLRLATLTHQAGLDGVVCSPQEVIRLREALPADFLLITPGVRPAGAATQDQKRVMTPQEALHAGSSYLVIGRPITQAPDPLAALQIIHDSLTDQRP